jgi:hypothetical protein
MPCLQQKINRSLLIIILLATIGLLSPGCSTIDSGKDLISEKLSSEDEMDEAVEAVDKFFQLLMDKDYGEAYKNISSKDREEKSQQDFISEFSDVTDIIKVEINWVEVKNNIALAGIDIIDSYDGEQKIYKDIEVSLVKEEDGSWKVVFWD